MKGESKLKILNLYNLIKATIHKRYRNTITEIMRELREIGEVGKKCDRNKMLSKDTTKHIIKTSLKK